MTWKPERVAIVGATGPTGRHLAEHLLARGRSVRVVSRRREHLESAFAGRSVEIAAADALDGEAMLRAVDGCDLVVDAIGLPPERMADHPATARVVAETAAAAGARCLQISSYWAFLPHRGEVVDESHPRAGGHDWFRWRREAEDVMLGAGAAVIHLPDFFGPHVHTSTIQMGLEAAIEGKPVPWLGGRGVARETAYVPDAMGVVARLLDREEAYGTDWAIPGNGVVSGDELARIAAEHLGRPVKVRAAPAWLLRVLSWFSSDLRAARPLLPHYARPVRYDTSKLRGLLGEVELRPMAEAVGETLDWLSERRAD